MAFIVVTEAGQTVVVQNGDTVVIDIPGGGDVTIVAADDKVRRFRIDYNDDDENGSIAIVDLSTFSQHSLHIDTWGYDESDRLTLDGAMPLGIEPGQLDEYPFDYVGADGETYSGFARIKDVGERVLPIDPPPIIICFAEGTVIDTGLGPRPIESLRAGDLVRTIDHGLQPLAWIGSRTLDRAQLRGNQEFRPVRIRAGALGDGLPWTDLTVSPQHRIRLADWRTEYLYGHREVLVPAKALVDGDAIAVTDPPRVTYFHLLFDRHELVVSNGIVSESLHPGELALTALGPGIVRDIERVIGDFSDMALARPVLHVQEARAALGYAA